MNDFGGTMDTITHGLFGYTLYKVVKREEMPKKKKQALLFTALVGSQIPDIDVVVEFTEAGRVMAQMWHRGLTHSIFLVPIWAFIIYGLSMLLFKRKDRQLYFVGLFAVFWHDTIDLFNAWGTGYFEPFSSARLSIGTIPIVDLVFWSIFLIGFLLSSLKKSIPAHIIYRFVAIGMLAHFSIQSLQGLIIEQQAKEHYEQTALTASFVPWHFQVVGKNGNKIEIFQQTLFSEPKSIKTLYSKEDTNLQPLFQKKPQAKVLYEWSPFVVIVNDEKRLGILDPRFLRNGEFFLAEYIEKK